MFHARGVLLRSCGCFKGERQRAVYLAWTVVELGNRRPPFSKLGLRIRRRGRRVYRNEGGDAQATREIPGRRPASTRRPEAPLASCSTFAMFGTTRAGRSSGRRRRKYPTCGRSRRESPRSPPLDQPGRQALPTRCRGRLARHFDTIGEQAQRPCQLLNGIKSCDSPAGLITTADRERCARRCRCFARAGQQAVASTSRNAQPERGRAQQQAQHAPHQQIDSLNRTNADSGHVRIVHDNSPLSSTIDDHISLDPKPTTIVSKAFGIDGKRSLPARYWRYS